MPVSAAGIQALQGIKATSDEVWERAMAVHSTGVLLGLRAVVPAMRRTGGGSIIITAEASTSAVEAGGYLMVLARRLEERIRRSREAEVKRLRAEERERLIGLIREANPDIDVVIPYDELEQAD